MSDLLLKKPQKKFFHGTPMMIVPMKKCILQTAKITALLLAQIQLNQMRKAVTVVRMSRMVQMMIILPHNLNLHLCYPNRYQEKMLLCNNVFHQELPKRLRHPTFLLPLLVFQEQLQEVL